MLAYDVCRCRNEDCDKKERCLRYIDKGHGALHLSLAVFKHENCQHFIKDLDETDRALLEQNNRDVGRGAYTRHTSD